MIIECSVLNSEYSIFDIQCSSIKKYEWGKIWFKNIDTARKTDNWMFCIEYWIFNLR